MDGNDVLAVIEVTRKAAERARRGDGASLIEAVTYRLSGHSTSDDPRSYRDDDEVASWQQKDPLRRLRAYLGERDILGDREHELLEEELKQEIQDGLKRAESVGPPPVESMFEDVFDEVPWHLKEQAEELEKSARPSPVGQEV